MHIKPTHAMTDDELHEHAITAADNSEPVHEACPAGLSVNQRNEFESAYVERRFELVNRRIEPVEGWRVHGFRHMPGCA